MKVMTVYRVTNLINGKCYIGVTSRDPNFRWWEHKNAAKTGGGFALHQAIRKYGEDNFSFDVLCCTKKRDDLVALEIYLIRENNSLCFGGHGYNMTEGGDGATHIGRVSVRDPNTNETFQTDVTDPRYVSGELVPANLGSKRADSSRRKISEAAKRNSKGALNPNSKLFRLTSPSGESFNLSGNVQKFCETHGLKYSALNDYIGRGPVPEPSKYSRHPKSTERMNTVGWSLERLS
ncbi:hypothetical protein phiA829_156 [Aeromonas phage phiA8-29]|uniref:GIY-YIG domain-containing protein n=1 Tax=Aeromonas phage phiA8-29 TaxID=1978922 RepID=A0A1W6DYM4_9CAUD|nr:homing endonuclease [Aeromonas phage phiA8-29]ARK07976.1 hypothetical protein phiA829_156 [Aeromonas phage phiA8-29]